MQVHFTAIARMGAELGTISADANSLVSRLSDLDLIQFSTDGIAGIAQLPGFEAVFGARYSITGSKQIKVVEVIEPSVPSGLFSIREVRVEYLTDRAGIKYAPRLIELL